MTFAHVMGGAALLASTAATAAGPASSPATPKLPAMAPRSALAGANSSIRLEYTDFSSLYGNRAILTADSKLGTGHSTRFSFSLSGGTRRTAGSTIRGAQFAAGVDRDWSDRLSTRTSVSLASNGSIFARAQLAQDISYELGSGLVATVGGKYASYRNRTNVTTWSAGAAYYLRQASLTYRFSLIDSNRLGRSQAHLASFRLKDAGGTGSTQLWVGHGSSLYEVGLPRSGPGRFTSVALQRSQPIGPGVAVNVGINRSWYRTPTANYRGTGALLGLSFSNAPR